MRRNWIIIKHVFLGFGRDDCLQLAAAISYYVLFSMVPLAIFTISILGFVLNSDSIRNDLVDRVLDTVPLTQTEGRAAVEHALDNVKRISGPVAVVGLLATLWTSSAVFASIRKSLNRVWGISEHRPFAQQKLVDLLQVGVLATMLLTSIVLTGVLRTIRSLNPVSAGPLAYRSPVWEIPPLLLPAVISFATFLLLYRIIPAARPRWRDVIPGALVATLLFEALKNSFAFYVANFNNFDVVYGSLAGLLLFLFFTYLSANILLIGAEISRTLQRYHAGELHAEIYPAGPQTPVATRAIRAVKGLFVRQ
ncbi:MAG: YihY/virulence factor BrkB family protein [Chloroflexota bacterium]|nr:YihY/virulence factor BrkB family protein [Chloroflexota bacterium]